MDINDIEIKIVKCDREKEVFIINLTFFNQLVVRGYRARYKTTKYSPDLPVWLISPPSVVGKGKKFFWIARIIDNDLWLRIQEKMIKEVENYPEDV